uniref:Calponin-homology (CH) domain-containing protein n=1 Tax=Glossina austeni TaxID=7395 RepID=A0A1A9V0G2_GLOAU
MSAFEVKMTPTRFKSNRQSERREPTDVVMAPFSGKSIVLFEDVPVSKIARRTMRIINPSDDEIKVIVSKSVKPGLNISLEWLENTVPAQNEITMELTWKPQMDISSRETLQFTDNRNFRKDVSIILKSKASKPIKNVHKYPNLSSGATPLAKALRLKSPTNGVNKNSKLIAQQKQLQKKRFVATERSEKHSTKTQVKWKNGSFQLRDGERARTFPLKECNNSCAIPPKNRPPVIVVTETDNFKENVTPLEDSFKVLNMIDEIQFSPFAGQLAVSQRSKPSNLDTIPTPLSYQTSVNGRGNLEAEHKLKPRCLTSELSEAEYVNCHEDIPSENTPSGTITNKTFDISQRSFECPIDCLNVTSGESPDLLDKTSVVVPTPGVRPLAVIEEEDINLTIPTASTKHSNLPNSENLSSTYARKTAVEDRMRDIRLVGTPLRKFSESMVDLQSKSPQSSLLTQGSLPNLNEMETIGEFEKNRYFKQSTFRKGSLNSLSILQSCTTTLKGELGELSLVSHPEVLFDQHEILAQSSRFNLNEIGIKQHKNSPTAINTQTRNVHRNLRESTTPRSTKASSHVTTKVENANNKRRLNELSFSECTNLDLTAGSNNQRSIKSRIKTKPDCISPPKRQRLDMDSTLYRSLTPINASANIRKKTWAHMKPKPVKLSRTLSLIKKPLTPCKLKTEPRIKLYDSELHLQSFINPDPFAATTTCDPFLASTMYLDEASVEKHECDFKKWLNALVTMPADLDTDSNTKIDVGKLFNEVRNKDLILAPTKEEQSMHYLTKFRLESLRRAAVALFLSEDLRLPCSKVVVYVQKDALRIRRDRNLHLDVVTQREILELLLCFNPLWLRLGLEVVYGEKVHLHSNKDIIGLSTFILNRLFRDKFLEQKYSKAYTLCEEYAEHIKKFTLQKFFLLLLFLDKAKEKRIIAHNPCLFVKKSPYKETRDILLKFSSELLANVGDVTRELRRLGYVLTHKQTYLDEFDYAFQNLAIDLRDGIRLTRVMEIILLREDLTKQLRVPAISRLQRIFNVNIALKSLSEADFQLKGDIIANDIVDGHREKTLSLLWQIIYKFRSPKFHAAAQVIQNWWRNSWLKVIVNRRIRRKGELKREKAAIVIQSAFRGYITRVYSTIYRGERTKAAIILQKYIRSYLARKKYIAAMHSILVIQHWYRASKLAKQYRKDYLELRRSATCIQRLWRLRCTARLVRAEAGQLNQQWQEKKQKMATIIQSYWRRFKARKQFLRVVSAVIVIQSRFRAHQQMKKARNSYRHIQETVKVLQQRVRAKQLMRKQQSIYQRIRSTVIFIQAKYRATLAMRKQRAKYLDIRQKVIYIQQKWRAVALARNLRIDFIMLQYFITVVQRKYRAKQQMRVASAQYRELKKVAIFVQRRYRNKLLMRHDRRNYELKKNAILTIQRHFRAYKAMRYQKAKYMGTKAAILCLQQHVRGFLAMKREREHFRQVKQAALIIQRRYRAHRKMILQREKYLRLKDAAVLMQRRFRATLLMREGLKTFRRQRELIVIMQRRFRANKLGQACRQRYLHEYGLIVLIQRRFRATQIMKTEKASYQDKRSKTSCIQRYYRNYMLGKRQRLEYVQQRNAAIKIQNWIRSIFRMRIDRVAYQRERKACTTIQQKWRATLVARQERQHFLNTVQKIIVLQRVVKATLQMRSDRQQYERQRSAAICLQRHFRARCEMLKIQAQYQLLRSLVICIQRKFRARQQMLQKRQEFLVLRSTTIRLQQKFRALIQMRKDQRRYTLLKNNVVQFQAHARGLMARQRFHSLMTPEMQEFRRRNKAAQLIQRFWRGYRIRNRFRSIKLLQIRRNIALLNEASNAFNTVHSKVNDAVKILRGRYCASEALAVLKSLDRISRTVPHLLIHRADFVSTFCYGIMAQAIRSEIDKYLIMYCSRIILNLARYNSTTINTFQEGGLVTIAQMLLRWCDKDCEIFNTLCTLIWVFAHCDVKRKIISDFMTTTDAIYMLRETKKLVARKEKMKQNLRKSSQTNLCNSPRQRQLSPKFSSHVLPSLEPDYGVIRTSPYTFISSVYAFDTVLKKLGIDVF